MSPGSIEEGPRATRWAGDRQTPTAAEAPPKSEYAKDETFVLQLRPMTPRADLGKALHHAILHMKQFDVQCIDSWQVGIDHKRAAAAVSKNDKPPGDAQ